jgi:hypothetical protein
MKPTLIEQVNARNLVNKTAQLLRLELIEVLARYKGKKIIKVTPYRDWISALKKEIDEIKDHFPGFRIIFQFGSYIYCEIDKSFSIAGSCGCFYVKKFFTLCCNQDNYLIQEENFDYEFVFKSDYDASEIEMIQKSIESKEAEIRSLESQIYEFM